MKVTIDRFESGFAVCETEDCSIINIEISKLPKGAKQGDVLIIQEDSITIDENETNKQKNEIKTLMDEVWE